jgi:hypothetical protein
MASVARQRSPVYEGRGPGKRMPPGPPQGTSVLHTLEKYFPECYTRFLGVGSLLPLRRWHMLSTLELVPFVGVELQLSAWYQVCCVLSSGLLRPMLHFHPPRDLEGDLMGLVPVAPYSSH